MAGVMAPSSASSPVGTACAVCRTASSTLSRTRATVASKRHSQGLTVNCAGTGPLWPHRDAKAESNGSLRTALSLENTGISALAG